jgi:hypothetical protein
MAMRQIISRLEKLAIGYRIILYLVIYCTLRIISVLPHLLYSKISAAKATLMNMVGTGLLLVLTRLMLIHHLAHLLTNLYVRTERSRYLGPMVVLYETMMLCS